MLIIFDTKMITDLTLHS